MGLLAERSAGQSFSHHIVFDSLGNFFPIFGNGTNLVSLIAGSAMIWGFGLLVMGGVNEAISINTIVVIAKIIPIAVMIGTIIFSGAFDWNILTGNMTGQGSGFSLMEQVRSTVYTTVWVFVGIEGAVVISGRAKVHRYQEKLLSWPLYACLSFMLQFPY